MEEGRSELAKEKKKRPRQEKKGATQRREEKKGATDLGRYEVKGVSHGNLEGRSES